MAYTPLGNGNLDFSSLMEGISAIQRNPQVSRISGTGTLSFSGSIIYAVILDQLTLQVSDITSSIAYGVAAPGISVPGGIPVSVINLSTYGSAGGPITVTPISSNVHWCVVYK